MEYGADPPYEDEDAWLYEIDGEELESEPPTTPLETHSPAADTTPRPSSETVALSARLQAIVDAAEQSAEQRRAQTEQRARERIAEADRAADYRVAAAEEEAQQILSDARTNAERIASDAVNAVDSIHAEAHETLREAKATLARARLDAEQNAREILDQARDEAREVVRTAHMATREVMDDGTELSEHLRELSASLRANAERLLRDIRLAHGSMTARLDQTLPEGLAASRSAAGARERGRTEDAPARRRARAEDSDPAVDFEVPDFVMPED